jgi:hypothetical protein
MLNTPVISAREDTLMSYRSLTAKLDTLARARAAAYVYDKRQSEKDAHPSREGKDRQDNKTRVVTTRSNATVTER